MLIPILLIVALAFVLLFVLRVGGAQRALLISRWPAVLLAAAAIVMLVRGGVSPALVLGALAVVAWGAWPALNRRLQKEQRGSVREDPADAEALRILGLTSGATESDIRRAYRAKMASAHPDRGGTNAEAARLTAARDRLLRVKR